MLLQRSRIIIVRGRNMVFPKGYFSSKKFPSYSTKICTNKEITVKIDLIKDKLDETKNLGTDKDRIIHDYEQTIIRDVECDIDMYTTTNNGCPLGITPFRCGAGLLGLFMGGMITPILFSGIFLHHDICIRYSGRTNARVNEIYDRHFGKSDEH